MDHETTYENTWYLYLTHMNTMGLLCILKILWGVYSNSYLLKHFCIQASDQCVIY